MSNEWLGPVPKREQLGKQMNFDEWCAAHGVYLNDNDNAAKAAKAMARRAWDASVAAERERLARDVAGLHMAQSVNNQNYPSAWHDGVDAALAVIRGA
jgi:hypothetical protein